MSSNTPNLNLTKPADSESYSVPIWNANWDKVDEFAGSFGQFTYVYKSGLGHVTGETRLDKFVRAYNANAFPIGKPFFGYISAGSQLLVMGYLYMSSNQLYGCGYIASYDGATIIRVQADVFTDALCSPSANKTYSLKSGNASYGVLVRNGNVVYFTVYNNPWNSIANTSITSNDSSAVTLAIPSGYRPIYNTEIKEALNNKRITVTTTGDVISNETFSGLNLRFSACWITNDALA